MPMRRGMQIVERIVRHAAPGDANRGLRAALVHGGIGAFAVATAGTALTFALSVLLARNLGPSGYGIYAYVVAVVSILAVPAQFGLPNLIVRETASAQAAGQWGRMLGLWRWAASVAALASLATAAAALAAFWLFADRVPGGGAATFLWGLVLVPCVVFGALRGAALAGLRRVVLGRVPEQLLRPALMIGLLGLWAAVTAQQMLTPAVAMSLNALAALLSFAAGSAWLRRFRPPALLRRPRPEYEASAWVLAALPLALAAVLQLLNSYTGTIMLGIFRTSAEVGIYRVAVSGAALVVFTLSAINTVLAPQLARFHAAGDREALQRLVTAAARIAVLAALSAALALVLLGRALLAGLFGDAFAAAYHAVVILAFGQLVNAALGPVGLLLNMTGHEHVAARAVAAGALVNVVLNGVLIPRFGVDGAALATAASLGVWNLSMWRSARRRLGIDSAAVALRKPIHG